MGVQAQTADFGATNSHLLPDCQRATTRNSRPRQSRDQPTDQRQFYSYFGPCQLPLKDFFPRPRRVRICLRRTPCPNHVLIIRHVPVRHKPPRRLLC